MRKYCGNIKSNDLGKKIIIYGWVNNIKNLGKIIFLNLRDREGIIQVVFFYKNKKLFKLANTLTNESCIQISGIVQKKNNNNNLLEVEIKADKLKIINYSSPIPLDLMNKSNKEEIKLKYRYLDLRNKDVLYPIKIRSRVVLLIHNFMQKQGFLHLETPFLTNSSPEGARDYLVPSRFYKNKFFALPQSPQLFKQLLMIAGIDKYYQIVRCFRDEDLRINRQPEFTQLDIETSFISSKKLINFMEKMIKFIWYKICFEKLNKFHIIKYNKSLKKYGTDKPDLRNPIIFGDLTNFFKSNKINNIFNITLKKEKIIFILIPLYSNKIEKTFLSFYKNYFYQKYNIKNFFWIKFLQNCKIIESSIPEIVNNKLIINKLISNIKNKNNINIFFLLQLNYIDIKADLNKIRIEIAEKLNLINTNINSFVWVIHFPLFKKKICNKILESVHHPFTSPLNNFKNLKNLDNKPLKVLSDSYDLVINGQELGGGSVRINNVNLQQKIFKLLNIEKNNKYSFFLEALKYGTPIHAGIAFGLDRLIMLLTKSTNIKDVIAFPKTNKGNCLLTNAPTTIEKNILHELNLKIK